MWRSRALFWRSFYLTAFWLYVRLPVTARDTLTAWGMGDLTVRDERLHEREVLTITVDELLRAMGVDA